MRCRPDCVVYAIPPWLGLSTLAIALQRVAQIPEQHDARDLLMLDDVLAEPFDVATAELDRLRMHPGPKVLSDDIR